MTRASTPHDYTRADRLKGLIEANTALAHIESLEELLPTLLRLAQDVTCAEGASILLYKPEKGVLEFTLALNDSQDTARELMQSGMEFKLGQGIAGVVAETRKPLIIDNAYRDDRFFKQSDTTSGFTTRSLICVPITNKDDLLGVVQVVNAKNRDNFDQDDLDVLQSFADLAAVALLRAQMLEAMLREERLRAQLDVAASIQENFLPRLPDLGANTGIWAKTRPAIHVGGDFYDCVPMEDGSFILAVVDVSGKGLPAALVATSLWTHLRTICSRVDAPQDILSQLNMRMIDVFHGELFATIALARFWPNSGNVIMSSGGHLPPIYVDGTGLREIEGLRGLPIGIEEDTSFTKVAVTLGAESSLVFVTDGVTEARQTDGSFFGSDRLHESLRCMGSCPRGHAVMTHIEEWACDGTQNDDVTVLEIWRR
ncbi:PP2C family protein-serine/threonine phosphatase [Oceanidesulfovibrio marinus]|uniref:Cyclic nucleotide-binding protein n=1 Tax=Oceanidesulfovibrio marinus TaxID=370038 RepID=A0A6P1ZJG5_9BACT|nr:SpoIIE family protein phosphatase [Oceanidesulfovibrio marinus]TVM35851.1 cyclic nucleotide-binding protein [Oceanidesulfovibrio marinus]